MLVKMRCRNKVTEKSSDSAQTKFAKFWETSFNLCIGFYLNKTDDAPYQGEIYFRF